MQLLQIFRELVGQAKEKELVQHHPYSVSVIPQRHQPSDHMSAWESDGLQLPFESVTIVSGALCERWRQTTNSAPCTPWSPYGLSAPGGPAASPLMYRSRRATLWGYGVSSSAAIDVHDLPFLPMKENIRALEVEMQDGVGMLGVGTNPRVNVPGKRGLKRHRQRA
jgi:hypothetical protein